MSTINKYNCDVIYLHPSRTIETITSSIENKSLFIYNYEGWHFRVFQSKGELNDFFEKDTDVLKDFFSEDKLDEFLDNYFS